MSKGSNRRPSDVPDHVVKERWERIFSKWSAGTSGSGNGKDALEAIEEDTVVIDKLSVTLPCGCDLGDREGFVKCCGAQYEVNRPGESERVEELLKKLSEIYLANPNGGSFAFVKTITSGADGELNALWREAYYLTHEPGESK